MIHLDLFSGIGGFALAAEWVWPDIEHIFVDNDLFCESVLKKHWPNAPIYGDIRTLTANAELSRYAHREPQKHSTDTEQQALGDVADGLESPFLLTGGFPCQPFSQAG